MPQTLFIETATLPRQQMPTGGEMADILSEALAGARNVTGTLRWLTAGQAFETGRLPKHQLVYVMEGAGTIELEGTAHAVSAGAGVYLGPDEQAIIRSDATGALKVFHLVVPRIPK